MTRCCLNIRPQLKNSYIILFSVKARAGLSRPGGVLRPGDDPLPNKMETFELIPDVGNSYDTAAVVNNRPNIYSKKREKMTAKPAHVRQGKRCWLWACM